MAHPRPSAHPPNQRDHTAQGQARPLVGGQAEGGQAIAAHPRTTPVQERPTSPRTSIRRVARRTEARDGVRRISRGLSGHAKRAITRSVKKNNAHVYHEIQLTGDKGDLPCV